MILNLGAGDRLIPGAVNIDIYPPANEIIDLSIFPWVWKSDSIDAIYMYHFLEHMPNSQEALKECHRILKKGGGLYINVPHSSSASAVGCLSHYRTFSYNSLKDYLSIHRRWFKTVEQRIVWLPHWEWIPIQWLIDLCPIFFERGWAYYVGGATEVRWKGLKI